MPYYLVQAAFAPEAATALLNNPEDRLEALRPAVENLGGSLEGAWLAFGEYDAVLLLQMPDNIGANAFSVAVSRGHAVKAIKTTPLMTVGEGMESAQRASDETDGEPPLLPAMSDEPDMTPDQIQELIAPNLEYAVTCAESAYQVLRELGFQGTIPTMNTAIARGVHFLQLAQHYLEDLQVHLGHPRSRDAA